MTFPCVYVLKPELVHPLCFSPFFLSPLLTVISTGLKKFYIHSCIESTSTMFTFFTSFFYPSSPISDLPLVCDLLFRVFSHCRSIMGQPLVVPCRGMIAHWQAASQTWLTDRFCLPHFLKKNLNYCYGKFYVLTRLSCCPKTIRCCCEDIVYM
jgi:hypothetical protein